MRYSAIFGAAALVLSAASFESASAADLRAGVPVAVGVVADDWLTPPAERRIIPWSGEMPACDEPRVLGKIQKNFHKREATYWNSGLRILAYEKIRHVAYRPWGASYIPRRYCTGVAHVAHGPELRHHRVNYVIREDLGPTGLGWDVQWCVTGVERHWHAAPNCEMMTP